MRITLGIYKVQGTGAAVYCMQKKQFKTINTLKTSRQTKKTEFLTEDSI